MTPDSIKKLLLMKKPRLQLKKDDQLSLGSTMLNLAITGVPTAGVGKGDYLFFVGDSMSGKTWFALNMFAEAARKKTFKDYAFIYDNPERGAKMDIAYYFGQRCADRLTEAPNGTSATVEEFYYNINTALDNGPCLYVLDSMDCLECEEDIAYFAAARKAHAEGKEVSGTFGTGKPRANSRGLRPLMDRLAKTGSILFIIAQTRDNIGFGAQFNPKTRSGGKALRFYAQIEVWTSVVKTLSKTVRGKKRQQGVITRCDVKKGRYLGQQHKVEVPIYHGYGIDDVGACLAFLINEKHWAVRGTNITAEELEYSGPSKGIVKHIEENNLEPLLAEVAQELWNEIASASQLSGRKNRYNE